MERKRTTIRGESALVPLVVALLSLFSTGLATTDLHAQTLFGGGSGSQLFDTGYLFFEHQEGRQLGDVSPFSSLGGNGFYWMDNGVWMLSGEALLTNNGGGGGSVGVTRRLFVGDSIVGGGLWFDANQSRGNELFQQAAFNVEFFLDDLWTVRSNGYLPIGPTVRAGDETTVVAQQVQFQGNNLIGSGLSLRNDEVAMKGIDVELARGIESLVGEVFVGYYNFQGRAGGQTNGIKGGVRGYVTPRLAANIQVSDDPLFGTNVYGGFTWFFGGDSDTAPYSLEDKLTIPVERNQQIVINETTTTIGSSGFSILTNQNQPITVMHVNDSGAPGDGSFENPHGSLTDANGDANKGNRDIVYVYSNTSFVDQGFTLAPDQRFLGEGNNQSHLVQTDQLGLIVLPNVNGIGNPRPIIQAPDGQFAINAANRTEISNINIVNSGNRGGVFAGALNDLFRFERSRISGGLVGIDLNGSSGSTTISQVEIENSDTGLAANSFSSDATVSGSTITGGDVGINILNSSGQFTFSDVTIQDSATAGIDINGGSSTVNLGGLSSIEQNLPGSLVRVRGNHSGSLTLGDSASMSATNGNGLQFDGANGTYNFLGQVDLNGSDAGIDILGNSSGTFTFSDTDITYSGTGAAVNIQDHNGGLVIFETGSSITATNGTGLQFNNADGAYDFRGPVTLNGGDAGIDILGNSFGNFTFSDTDITYSNTGAAVNVQDHLGGSFLFDTNSSLTATNGTGLQFNNADGNYEFRGPVTLNGGDAGIDILNNSAGTFTFSDQTSIINPSGVAFRVNDFDATGAINYNGSISGAGGSDLVEIDRTAVNSQINFFANGANTISGDGAGGILILDADGDITFTTPVDIRNPANGTLLTGVSVFGGNGRINFLTTNITLPGDGFNAGIEINGHTGSFTVEGLNVQVNGSGTPGSGMVGLSVFNAGEVNLLGENRIDITGGDAISLNGVGGINMTFNSISSTNSQTGFGGGSGITLTGVGGGTFDVTGTTSVQGANGPAGIGIDIDSSSGTFTFADVDIDGTTLDGVAVGSLFGNPGTVNINGGSIRNTGANGVLVNNAGGFNLNDTTFVNTTGFTVDTTGSTLSGNGNLATPFSCNDGGGNVGFILFNGGADSCP